MNDASSTNGPAADVLTFGEAMLSLQAEGAISVGGTARVTVAGAESNVAVGLARLGHRVTWAGRLGADEPGRLVLRALRGEGVDTRHVTTDHDAPTGAMLRERRVADLARVHYWRAGSAASRLRFAHLLPALAEGARVLHLTGITCALGEGPLAAVRDAAEYAGARGWTVALDVNHRARLWTAARAAGALRPLLGAVDVLIASDDELPLVADADADAGGGGAGGDQAAERERVRRLFGHGVREVVVKRGPRGATLYAAADAETDASAGRAEPERARRPSGGAAEPRHAPARPVPVADTVGAGDAFCAGYLSGLLDGLSPDARLRRATTTAAFAVAGPGDWEGLPHRDELPLLDAEPGGAVR